MSREGQEERFRGWDWRLRRLLAARSRRDAERLLERIYSGVLRAPVERVLSEEIGSGLPATLDELSEETDIFNDLSFIVRGRIAVRLLRLWEIAQAAPSETTLPPHAIGNIIGYAVVSARNACVDYLRQEYPGRHALDNSLRAALMGRLDLALWTIPLPEGAIESRCGKPEWHQENKAPIHLRANPMLQPRLREALEGLSRAEALTQVFEIVHSPLRFTDLLNFLADYWDVERAYQQALRESVPLRVPKPYQSGLQPEEIAVRIGTLQSLWDQVRRLTTAQAAVLLLKAPQTAEGNFLMDMVRLDVASWAELAHATGFSVSRIRELGPNVPLEDQEIAREMGVAPEDVPRVRQDARRRLSRQQKRWKRQQEEP